MDHTLRNSKPIVHVEIGQSNSSLSSKVDIIHQVNNFILNGNNLAQFGNLDREFQPDELNGVKSIKICDMEEKGLLNGVHQLCECDLRFHVYRLHEEGPATEDFCTEDNSEGAEQLPAASHWLLPASDFHGLWESLVFDSDIKTHLLHYVSTTLLFSEKSIDPNIISWNKVVLLHGPPGTGKTSLCKALAQKLSIHLDYKYKYGQFFEINSHSLFSKWFSESGKLVMKLFNSIQDYIEDRQVLVILLIDEVESLTHARKSSMSGSEPSDSIRVVNALLTQLDQIKRHPNVLILTTSNVTGAIDLAFVDRADIKQYIGPPSAAAIYKIFTSCVNELMRTGVICPAETLLSLRSLELARFAENSATRLSLQLRSIASQSEGLSGRTLRKLPLLAHAWYIQTSTVNLETFLDALSKTVMKQFQDQQELAKC